MRIANNLMAMNAHRQLMVNQGGVAKSIEKLSSGLRINRAGDDAAGLAISEKMRGQIRGLNQAIRNAQDGISLIQTAEGALAETHSILQRMRELAVQAANDTNTEVDRGEIQKEIDQLAVELTRIANTTEFNTKTLLDGTFKGTFHIGANQGQNLTLAINDMSADALGVAGDAEGLQVGEQSAVISENVNLGNVAVDDGATYTVEKLATPQTLTVQDGQVEVGYVLKDADGNIVAVGDTDGVKYYIADEAKSDLNDLEFTQNDATVSFGAVAVVSGTVTVSAADTGGNPITLTADSAVVRFVDSTLKPGDYTVVDDNHALVPEGSYGLIDSAGNLVAQSADGEAWQDILGNDLFSFNLSGHVGETFTVTGAGGIDVSTQAAADRAITIINDAIETVSAERSKLGALQNRLEHTIANLGASAENLQAAESRIRDVDMAKEMMEFTKYQILQQASTAMLAQANLAPQSVLQLLG